MDEQTTTTETAAETTAQTAAAPAEPTGTENVQPTSDAAQNAQTAAQDGSDGQPKPFLGEQKPKEGEQTKTDVQKPATEEDYVKAVVKDEALLGTDKNVQIDKNLVKAVIPMAQELGVSPESMCKLANALAKAQVDAAREKIKERADYFNRMKEESIKKYNNDFTQINAGIDHWFKPGGIMNNVIRNSELGADPEFLALMNYLGSKRVMDSLEGVAEGGGEASGDPNGIGGISKIW